MNTRKQVIYIGINVKGDGRKFSRGRGGGATKKRQKISKKYQKIALFSSSGGRGGNGKNTKK